MASTGRRITIPPEMMMEILYRLPVKSICRFKCVSKVWLSLLSSPHFIKTHHQTLDQKHLMFVANHSLYSVPVNHHENSVLIPLQFQFKSRNLYFNIRSCNGLVLASYINPNDAYKLDPSYNHVVVNPITMEFRELLTSHQMRDGVSKTESTCGFCYDPVSDDYKVVTVFHFRNKYSSDHFEKMHVHVYSLRTNNWTRVFDTPNDHSPYKRGSNCVFINKYIHWFSRKGPESLVVIIAFSLSDETFSEVCLPDDDDIVSKNGDAVLIDIGGKLGIFLEAEGEIWLMNEYGIKESWTKISLIGLDEFSMIKPMIFYDNGKIMVADDSCLLTYDVEKRSFCKCVEIFLKHEMETYRDEMIITSTYAESVASPKLIMTNQASVDLSKGFEELEMVFEVGEKNA